MGGKTKEARTPVEPASPITLGAQVGDQRANEATGVHHTDLRKLLRENCVGPYSAEIDEFAFVLRIDGDIWHWDFEGAEKLRLSRKRRYITVDIGVPRSRWQGVTAEEIRKYLADSLEQGLAQMVEKLTKSKIDVNAEALTADFSNALRKFQEA
jgi:hypothetical protein